MNIILEYYLLLQCLDIIKYARTEMPNYCLQELNASDCNETPVYVFSYYRPGSRCEMEVWRGCPTSNKFDTEEQCSDVCIFRNVEVEKKIIKKKSNEKCTQTEDFIDCGEKLFNGFKYDQVLKDCVEVTTGCSSPNLFEDKLECVETCVRDVSWEEKMRLASEKQLKELDSILQSLVDWTEDDDEELDNGISTSDSTNGIDSANSTTQTDSATNTVDNSIHTESVTRENAENVETTTVAIE